MASTAHSDPEMMKERSETKEELQRKVDLLTEYIKQSKHFIVFTGAGVSTSAGIPDFRGPDGVWTLKAQGKKRTKKATNSIKAFPTLSHMSIVCLQERGICKYLVSQNCDGLHRKSGIKPQNISELHGNGNIEYCESCGKRYLRDFHCYRIKRGRDHYTGRHCVVKKDGKVCNGRLLNSTIDFGQNLPVEPLEKAVGHGKKADLCLVLGSSLTVNPAAKIPKYVVKKGGKLVICNLQRTAHWGIATMNIHEKCDKVMEMVMEKLGLEIPRWELKRKIEISGILKKTGFECMLRGIDYDEPELPASIIRELEIKIPGKFTTKKITLNKEPFKIQEICSKPIEKITIDIRVSWMGWYKEPPIKFQQLFKLDTPVKRILSLHFKPSKREWILVKNDNLIKTENRHDSPKPNMKKISKNSFTFKEQKTEGEIPIISVWGQMVSLKDSKNTIRVFKVGGVKKQKERQEIPSIFEFDTKVNQWKKIIPKIDENSRKLPFIHKQRWGFTATAVPSTKKIFFIGGFDHKCQYNDVHVYDIEKNTLNQMRCTGLVMSYRAMHSSVLVNDKIVCFGGCYCDGGPYEHYNDAYVFNTSNGNWKIIETSGDIPKGRSQHSCTTIGTKMFLFGGANANTVFNDVYVLDLVELKWKKLKLEQNDMKSGKINSKDFRIHPTRTQAFTIKSPLEGGLFEEKILIVGDGLFIFDSKKKTLKKINDMNLCCESSCSLNTSNVLICKGEKIFHFKMD